jgi:glucose-6-phosphate dehydrogenase assembly protein OpcA
VADALTDLGKWEGHDVRLPDVLAALDRLRCAGQVTATRTSVVSLVVVAPDAEAGQRACDTMNTLGARHPGRTIVLVLDGAEQGHLDAIVTLHAAPLEGIATWSEEVVLTVRGGARRHLDSLVEPLTLADLPVVVWYFSTGPRPGDPLVETADIVLVDTKEMGDVAVFPEVLELARRRPLIDLSWVRLTPWRVLLAGLFDGAAYRKFVTGVHAAEVHGKPGPRHLLAGWLASRLDLPRRALHLADARHAALRLSAEAGAERAVFVAERRGEERLVRASAHVENGPSHEELLPLPDTSLAWSLAHALSDLEGDPIYEQALAEALDLVA